MAVVSLMALTNWKFASISSNSSFSLWLTLVIHCSFSFVVKKIACSKFMYRSIVALFLCPNTY